MGIRGITRHQFGKGSGIYMTGFAFFRGKYQIIVAIDIRGWTGKNRQNALQIICM